LEPPRDNQDPGHLGIGGKGGDTIKIQVTPTRVNTRSGGGVGLKIVSWTKMPAVEKGKGREIFIKTKRSLMEEKRRGGW